MFNLKNLSLVCFLVLSVGVAHAETKGAAESTGDAVPAAKSSTSGLVFSLTPQMGIVNPKALNDSTTVMNTVASGGFKVSGTDVPAVSNTLQADAFLGYTLSENLDLGAFLSVPPVSSKKFSGQFTPTGASVTRTAGLSTVVYGLQAHYTFAKVDSFKFFVSPSVGVGSFSAKDQLDNGVAKYDLQIGSQRLAVKGSLGVTYQINSLFSLNAEGGYQYWNSGDLKYKADSATIKAVSGEPVKTSSGDTLKMDLSGPFVGVGMTLHYSI